MKLEMLDVLIGLVSIYLLLSLVCSALVEGINRVLNRRGATLRSQLERLMGPTTLEEFCSLPGFEGLMTRGTRRFRQRADPDSPAPAVDNAADLTEPDREPASGSHRTFPSYIPTETFAELSLAWYDTFNRGREWCDYHEFGRVLTRVHSDDSTTRPARLKRIGEWFDQAMARTSGNFKARTNVWYAGVALIVVLAANADSIRLANEIYRSPAIQATLVDKAKSRVATKAEGTIEIATLRESLRDVSLFGWEGFSYPDSKTDCARCLSMVMGWLVTILALMMGADFWLNALGKLIQIRTSLKPAGRSADAASPSTKVETGGGIADVAAASITVPTQASTIPVDLHERAKLLAHAAQFAYANAAAALPQALVDAGYRSGELLEHGPTGTQCRLLDHDNHLVLSFRGTEPSEMADVQTDLKKTLGRLALEGIPYDPSRVHQGFASALDGVWRKILQAIDTAPERPLLITGHSLGGALAVLAAYALRRSGKSSRIIAVMTFGQPRVGDAEFAQACDRMFGPTLLRVVNHRDVVTRLAPRSMGYRHAGRVLYIDVAGKLSLDPSAWFRLLDRIPIDPNIDWNSQVREYLADHRMGGYVERLTKAG